MLVHLANMLYQLTWCGKQGGATAPAEVWLTQKACGICQAHAHKYKAAKGLSWLCGSFSGAVSCLVGKPLSCRALG